ncbi:hypothetical protein [Pleionea mediterranea]|uniref:MazG C-terminal domain-containing protein n=1 Tax=Pleionea mediterranea TaxID=523701 RepID=A0A316FWA6_9GAMM|nr:hypothetical protein [Pleionea mediterranea]PWK52849.1 hypothetical protein C8D97_10467 [Pleionea mediterranea]
MNLTEYLHEINKANKIKWSHSKATDFALSALLGELGSLATAYKKQVRDGDVYTSFKTDLKEELGDLLWYSCILGERIGFKLKQWPMQDATEEKEFDLIYKISKLVNSLVNAKDELQYSIENKTKTHLTDKIERIITLVCKIAILNELSIDNIASENVTKVLGYWIKHKDIPAYQFDKKFPNYEQLPRKFQIDFIPVDDSTVLVSTNGVIIGDRLTDNAHEPDGYKFHDVFHIANAATLGWSPVFRRMLKLKRKSDPKTDEIEDGARAAIIEEAIVSAIYDYGRDDLLKDSERVSLELIKRIQSYIKGYEAQDLEPWEWEHCILSAFRVFREINKAKCGSIVGDADKRTITLQKLEPGKQEYYCLLPI